ncbi:MAG TPA: hypothetical protein VGU22_02750 [Methylomirabilota bacterium]|jgi:hypothetical protein|nr:hypothetical protein [Methylomirabilota bacterium]
MFVPERWQEVIELLLAPIAWVPRMQEVLIAFFVNPAARWVMAAKYVFLLLPALLALAAIWITMLSLYTLPFRSGRMRFVSMMLLAWWDAARSVWLYWVGVVRVAAVTVGWIMSLAAVAIRLVLESLRQLVTLPFTMTGRMTQSYFQPGVPWIAFAMLLAWCVLEATVFTYTMIPAVTGVLSDLSGGAPASPFTSGVLFVFLLLLVMGSFACLQALVDAVRTREFKFMAQIVVVELLVMFFEVMFLYRQFIDALTPWIARETGMRLGVWSTMALASIGWLGTRAMTWFLFAQYGTAPMLAFISRRPLVHAAASELAPGMTAMSPMWWRAALEDFKRELEWLHAKSDQLLEYLALPVLQLLAAGLNFAMMMVASRPAFPLPFKTLKEVTDTRDILATFHLTPRKQPSV